MAYTKTEWSNNDPTTPLDEVHLNKIEDGIKDAHTTADNATSDITTINTTLTGYGSRLDSLDGVGGDIESIETNITALETADTNQDKYNTWRNISADPSGDIIADVVDNIFISWASDTSVLLPATPDMKSKVRVCDAGADFSSHNVTIKRNNNKIMGSTNDYVFNYVNGSIELGWSGAVYGWVITRSV